MAMRGALATTFKTSQALSHGYWCFQAFVIIYEIHPVMSLPDQCGLGVVLEPIITQFRLLRRWELFLRGLSYFALAQYCLRYRGNVRMIIWRLPTFYYQGVFMTPKTYTHVITRIHARNLLLKSVNWSHHNAPRSNVYPPFHCPGFF